MLRIYLVSIAAMEAVIIIIIIITIIIITLNGSWNPEV